MVFASYAYVLPHDGCVWLYLIQVSLQISGPTKVNVEMLLDSLRKEGEVNMIGAQTLVLDSKRSASQACAQKPV